MSPSLVQDVLEEVRAARSFDEAANKLTDCAQALTGCDAAMLRVTEGSEEGAWIPALVERGFGCRFLRDEVLIGADECLCGRVCRGCPDTSFPFFTPNGSFVWGHLSSITEQYPLASLGGIRGRCVIEGFDSLGIFPLMGESGPVGCLHLADAGPDRFKRYAGVLESICRESGRVLAAFTREEREASIVRAVETALMPPDPPSLPGLELAVSFTSATKSARMGGDFYDVFELEDGDVLLLVGDYTGHGITAAGMAARARYTISGLLGTPFSLGDFFARANDALHGVLPRGRFVTLAAVRYSSGGSLGAGLAGHPRPLILRQPDEVEELLLPPNRPLGLMSDLGFETGVTQLGPNETVVLFTDGISDSRRGGDFFGVEGIMGVCRETGQADLPELTSSLCRLSASFHDPLIPVDDRLAFAARVR